MFDRRTFLTGAAGAFALLAAPHIAIEIDRDIASRLGLSASMIDETLYDIACAFSWPLAMAKRGYCSGTISDSRRG